MVTMELENIIQVNNLTVTYKQNDLSTTILENLSFHLTKGEIVTILGESGSGKSTIAKAITGLLPQSAHISSGTLRVNSNTEEQLSNSNIHWNRIRGKQIAMLFQDAQQALNPLLRIRDHFKECLLYHQLAKSDEVELIAATLLAKLNFSDGRRVLDCYPFQLSGGMCQRVCLALALCLQPSVLIADEPTSALDTIAQKEVLELLMRMKEEFGLTVLLITHDIAIANAVSNRVIVINKGRIVEVGDTKSVFTKPQDEYTQRLLTSRSYAAEPTTSAEKLRQGKGNENNRSDQVPLLEIIQLEKKFNGRKNVLHDVNLKLNSREILGILGQSGCGKSTLARCIVGLEQVNKGRVLYRGQDISQLKGNARRQICQRIQMVFQDARASLNARYTAVQLVQEPLHYLNIGQKKEREEKARFYLDETGIHGDAQNRRPPQLSSGQCQRIAIARALVLEPDILICDEAVSALDMYVQGQILALLQKLTHQFKFSILMISHDIRVLQLFCQHIAVMNHGTFCEVRSAAQLYTSKHSYTNLLLKCAADMEAGLEGICN
ncbi:ABC transporter ATP-binding protein [Paenibacillus solani]|uniref:ABC transporter ATP-binding protein n=1 Tax=Paenibacillus solani TaxID=1705565 RepID=UPI003D27D2C8